MIGTVIYWMTEVSLDYNLCKVYLKGEGTSLKSVLTVVFIMNLYSNSFILVDKLHIHFGFIKNNYDYHKINQTVKG